MQKKLLILQGNTIFVVTLIPYMNLQVVKYDEKGQPIDLTLIEIDGNPWFVASEVCKLLGIKNISDAVSRLDDDEKGVSELPTPSGTQKKLVVSESGLYELIFRSNKKSAKAFRKWVTKEVIPSVRKKGYYGSAKDGLPNFTRRYFDNIQHIERGYFAVITELFVALNGEFEKVGYTIPETTPEGKTISPDISVGRTFANYLKKIDSPFQHDFKRYNHHFPDGRTVEARMYPNEALGEFRNFVLEVWIPEKSRNYFKDRAPKALEYLPTLLKSA